MKTRALFPRGILSTFALFFALFFALCFAIAFTGTASASAKSCSDLFEAHKSPAHPQLYEDGYRPPRDLVYSEKDLAEFRGWFGISEMKASTIWYFALTRCIDYRVAQLTSLPVQKRKALEIKLHQMRRERLHFVDSTDISRANGVDKIVLPKVLEDTPLPYIILAHEMEHMVQFELAKKGVIHTTVDIIRDFLDPMKIHQIETGAMMAEWNLAHVASLAPAELKQEWLKRIDSLTGIELVSKWYSHMLTGGGETQQKYIEQNRAIGRYSPERCVALVLYRLTKIGLGVSAYHYLWPF